MNARYYEQRQHLVQSLDSLVHQLFTLSFLMSPSVFIYLSRFIAQIQCSKPREFDSTYPLRFYYGFILFCNAIILWIHAMQSAGDGRALVIDFIGMSYTPSRLQLLSLDLFIIVLQLLVTTLSYETQLYYASEADVPDVLLPDATTTLIPLTNDYSPLVPNSLPSSPSDTVAPEISPSKDSRKSSIPCIVDLKFSPVINRLRNPAPTVPHRSDSLLPLPNTSALPIPAGLRMIMRANARTRRERGTGDNVRGTTRSGGGNGSNTGGGGGGRIPGGLG